MKLTQIYTAAKKMNGTTDPMSVDKLDVAWQTKTKHQKLNRIIAIDRSRNQKWAQKELEMHIAQMENGKYGFCFSNGHAAFTAVLSMFLPEDHLIVTSDVFKGTYSFVINDGSMKELQITYLDTYDLNTVMHAVTSNTKAIIVESPSSILMKVTDLSKLSSFSKELGILLIVDNSQMTFYLQCPIDLGADVVLYSSSAQLSTDLSISAGFVVTDQDMLEAQIRMIQKKDVTTHSPHDCQTILKDIKALPLRMDIQQENAIELAGWLKSHPKISEVNYIGLPEHPGYILSKYQASGFGGMLSFCVQSEKVVEQLMQRLRTISIVDHFDGMDFLLYQIASRDRTGVPEVQWNKGIDDSLLVKLFVGTEKIDDLILDFEQALEG